AVEDRISVSESNVRTRPCVTRTSLSPTSPTVIHSLSLHDALPISGTSQGGRPGLLDGAGRRPDERARRLRGTRPRCGRRRRSPRSEEHTSELQSRENLVCRLLLEKKKKKPSSPSVTTMMSSYSDGL